MKDGGVDVDVHVSMHTQTVEILDVFGSRIWCSRDSTVCLVQSAVLHHKGLHYVVSFSALLHE
jgi:hypothetical protein